MAKVGSGIDLIDEIASGIEPSKKQDTGPYRLLPLDSIEPDPSQPRRFTNADQDDPHNLQELADSILTHGILQPIAVRDLGNGKYQIVTGERRWRAAQLALKSGEPCAQKNYDLATIPALVIAPENDADRLEKQLVENLARLDMNPVDTAAALQKLLSLGVSQRDLAKRLGKSQTWVNQILSVASPEAAELSAILGIPVEEIGQANVVKMRPWLNDNRIEVLRLVAEKIRAGEPYSRSLVDAVFAEWSAPKEPEPALPEPASQTDTQPTETQTSEPEYATDDDPFLDDAPDAVDDEVSGHEPVQDREPGFAPAQIEDSGGSGFESPAAPATRQEAVDEVSKPTSVQVDIPYATVEKLFQKAEEAVPASLDSGAVLRVLERLAS